MGCATRAPPGRVSVLRDLAILRSMAFLHNHWEGLLTAFALGLSIRFWWDAIKALKKACQYRDEMKEHANEAQAWYSKTQEMIDMHDREIRKFEAKFGLGGDDDTAPPKDRVN